jgi:hypothetical protein
MKRKQKIKIIKTTLVGLILLALVLSALSPLFSLL